MSKVDWSKSPEGATHFGMHQVLLECGYFKLDGYKLYFWQDEVWKIYNCEKSWNQTKLHLSSCHQLTEWPSEQRIEQIGQNGATGEHYEAAESAQNHDSQKELTKYRRNIKGAVIDVYDVLVAYNVTCPATAHAIKKMLMPGERHAKTWMEDIDEAILALERAKELRQ